MSVDCRSQLRLALIMLVGFIAVLASGLVAAGPTNATLKVLRVPVPVPPGAMRDRIGTPLFLDPSFDAVLAQSGACAVPSASISHSMDA
jgi:hypothetical protein